MSISRRHLLGGVIAGSMSGAKDSLFRSLSARSEWQNSGSTVVDLPLRLDRNENAYGPSPKAIQAMRASLDLVNRYPDEYYRFLVGTIADVHSVKPEQILLGCGATEIIRMAAAAFLGPKKAIITAVPTFDRVSREARKTGAEVIAVPLTKQYAHDLKSMLNHITDKTGLIYLCNPNNPTGTITAKRDLDTFIQYLPPKIPILVDEAYCDYVGDTSSYISLIDPAKNDDRIIVTRTFSKIFGLAGLRVGYAITTPGTNHRLSRERLKLDVNIVAAKAGAAALLDSDYALSCRQRNFSDRQEFLNQVNARMLRALDSHTNFVFVNAARPSAEVVEHFKKNNILVGPVVPEMNKYVRVGLGTPPQMEQFWRVWDLMPAGKMSM